MNLLSPYPILAIAIVILLLLTGQRVFGQSDKICGCAVTDSSLKEKVAAQWKDIKKGLPDSLVKRIRKMEIPDSLPPVNLKASMSVRDHSLSYTASHVSRIEGVYDYKNILQQTLQYSSVVSMANLPVRVSLYGRYSNSSYFRNYLDFNIDLTPSLHKKEGLTASDKLQEEKYKQWGKKLNRLFNERIKQVTQFDSFLNAIEGDGCINSYIHSKEIIANREIYMEQVEGGRDSVQMAADFIDRYEHMKHLSDSLKQEADSIVNSCKNLLGETGTLLNPAKYGMPEKTAFVNKMTVYLKQVEPGFSDALPASPSFIDGFSRLAIGRSMPAGTSLSLQDISLNGLNVEYNFGRFFTYLQAGVTDFGLRDFVFSGHKTSMHNLVYATGVGMGSRKASYLLFNLFGGKKQEIFPTAENQNSHTMGVSLAGRLSLSKLVLSGEIAQSGGSGSVSEQEHGKARFSIRDQTNRAYSFSAYWIDPRWNLSAEAYYKYYGINYYGFNAYRINANNSQWGVKVEKQIWGNSLKFTGGIKKNDYTNPYVQQVYTGKNIVTTAQLLFRKDRWVVSAGYIPSYQYVMVGDVVYENNYQVFNFMAGYSCKVGNVPLLSSLNFTRFLNSQSDTAYFFGNSSSLSVNEGLYFNRFSIGFNTSLIRNHIYDYVIFDGSLQYQLTKLVSLKCGFKMSMLTAGENQSKTGVYGSTSFNVFKNCVVSFQLDCNYLPDIHYKLYSNTMGVLNVRTNF